MDHVVFRYRILALLTILFAVAAWGGRGIWLIDAFAANVAAGFLGVLVTVVLIDRASERRLEEQRDRVVKLATAQLRRPLILTVQFFADMIKAASPAYLQDFPSTLDLLFGEENINQLDWVDLYGSAGGVGRGDWITAAGSWLKKNLDEMSGVIDKFVAYVPVELTEAVETLRSDFFMMILAGYPSLREELVASSQSRKLTLNGTMQVRKQFFDRLLTAIREYERLSMMPIPVPSSYLRNDTQPLRGSCRVARLSDRVLVGEPPPSEIGQAPYSRSPA